MATAVHLSGAVEGIVDEAVLARAARAVNAEIGPVFGRNGKSDLLRRLGGFNFSAQHGQLWVVVVDLDTDAECAPPACASWLPTPAPSMCFRIAVREIESWLLADRETLAGYLSVSPARIPHSPESVPDPKGAMVDLARHSRRRQIREDMVPRPESGRQVGPAYSARLIEYTLTQWRPEIAIEHADSLRRCMQRLSELIATKS